MFKKDSKLRCRVVIGAAFKLKLLDAEPHGYFNSVGFVIRRSTDGLSLFFPLWFLG